MSYVKICPVCGYKNPEDEAVCQGSGCNEFVAQLEPVLDTETSQRDPVQNITPAPSAVISNHEKTVPSSGSSSSTKRYTPPGTERYRPQPSLHLLYSGREYEIVSGAVMGKQDPQSSATLQIPGLPDYIHRRHCKFDVHDGEWTVSAIKNPEFTNPTYVNTTRIEPNQNHKLRHGDRLSLCDITFTVRII